MTSPAYRKLIDDLCELTMIPNPSAFYESASLSVKEVDFSLMFNAGHGAGDILIYCGFGPLPRVNREAVMQRLLESNLYLFNGPFSPSLSYNAETGQVVLVSTVLMENITAERLLDLLGHIAGMALNWQSNYFIDGDAPGEKAGKGASAAQANKRPTGLNASLSTNPAFKS